MSVTQYYKIRTEENFNTILRALECARAVAHAQVAFYAEAYAMNGASSAEYARMEWCGQAVKIDAAIKELVDQV